MFFYNAFHALAYNGIDGDYVEFGCAGGLTFVLAYIESRRNNRHNAHLWAFDSFQGLPAGECDKDKHRGWVEGALTFPEDSFRKVCASNKIPESEYTIVPGFYKDTLRSLAPGEAPDNIALAYIDCDMYSSTCQVLEFLMPRLKHGMIIAFDDYFCWSATHPSGERQAMLEYFGGNEDMDLHWRLEPYMQYGWGGQSFVVERRDTR